MGAYAGAVLSYYVLQRTELEGRTGEIGSPRDGLRFAGLRALAEPVATSPEREALLNRGLVIR